MATVFTIIGKTLFNRRRKGKRPLASSSFLCSLTMLCARERRKQHQLFPLLPFFALFYRKQRNKRKTDHNTKGEKKALRRQERSFRNVFCRLLLHLLVFHSSSDNNNKSCLFCSIFSSSILFLLSSRRRRRNS